MGYAQNLFYQETFRGGTTGAGFSTALGTGSGTFNIYIEPGSTIKKAWLFGQRLGYPKPANIVINSSNYIFDSSLVVVSTPMSGSSFQCSPFAIDVIDVTNDINPLVTNYNITIPITNQNSPQPCWGYSAFYLIVLYENNSLPLHHSVILLNNKQIITNTLYNVTHINPINTSFPVGFGIFSDRLGDPMPSDGSNIYFNTNLLGLIGGSDAVNNLWTGAGVKGHFYYQNNNLFGLDDDTPDSLMNGTDGLADVKSYLNFGDTAFNYLMQYQIPNNHTNLYNAWFLTYTTPCDTFSTSISPTDTICFGDSVQLNATGGKTYSWFGAFGGLSDTTVANPKASPPQTTTYICTITNDSGCVKTEHVKIWVLQPILDSITTTPTVCGAATGSITAHYNNSTTVNFTLYNSLNQVIANNTNGVFNQLPQGNYILQSTTNNCTFYDTVQVSYTVLTQAAFHRTPYQGKAPLTVTFTNVSTYANQYVWLFPTDTFYTKNLTYTFNSGGTYPVCLVAQNTYPYCADTTCYTFIVESNVAVIIPNVFSPNNDGVNDNLTLQLIDASLINGLAIKIYNRWGQEVASSSFTSKGLASQLVVWDGYTNAGNLAPAGTYFYVITYTTVQGDTKSEKGSVSLLR